MKTRPTLRSLLLGCSLISTFTAYADTLTWDNVAATGSWNTTDLNWTGAATWNNATPDDAVFGATGVGTVTLTEAITAGSITFDTAGYTVDTSTFGLTLNTGITANQSATIQSGIGGSIILGADNDWSVASSRTLTVSSPISGGFGITKSGAGTLTLSGANTYTGGTTLSAGVLSISNANSLSSGSVSVTGNSSISAAALTYANDISIDASRVLTLGTTGAANSTSTFSGAITGDGGITLALGVNQGTTVNLSSTNNTFTGNITLQSTLPGRNDFINFASIGDGGSIIYGRSSWRANATYTGSAALNLNTRAIALATTFGGGYDGGGNPTHMFANNGAGVVTFAQDMVMTTTTTSGIFFFGGTNTGDNTFAGAIGDSSNGTTVGIGKWDAGKWILSNNTNSFEGNVVLARGTLSVGVIDVAANAQPLGKGSLIVMGYRTADIGTLEYTGSGNAVTDKQIAVGTPATATNNNFRGGGVILNNGTGTLTFSNTTFNSTAGVPATGTGRDRTLTLGGTNTGTNTISGTIQDNNNGTVNAKVFLAKTGAGTWILEGDNTYTGGTTVSAGTLTLNGSLADATMSIATGATVNCTAAGTLTFNVDGITADQVVNDGSFNLGGLTVAVNATGAGLTESEYILVDATGGGTISGTFAGVTGAPGYTLDYGTPNQVKLVGGAPSDPYDAWAGGPGLPFDDDANGDGVSNGLAWLLGAADKDVSALNKLPTVSQSGGDLVLTFTCLKLDNRGTASLTLQYSKDLGISDPWTSNEVSVPDAAGSEGAVTFTVPSVNPDSALVNLQATIPASEAAPGTKLFGRLKAVKP